MNATCGKLLLSSKPHPIGFLKNEPQSSSRFSNFPYPKVIISTQHLNCFGVQHLSAALLITSFVIDFPRHSDIEKRAMRTARNAFIGGCSGNAESERAVGCGWAEWGCWWVDVDAFYVICDGRERSRGKERVGEVYCDLGKCTRDTVLTGHSTYCTTVRDGKFHWKHFRLSLLILSLSVSICFSNYWSSEQFLLFVSLWNHCLMSADELKMLLQVVLQTVSKLNVLMRSTAALAEHNLACSPHRYHLQ